MIHQISVEKVFLEEPYNLYLFDEQKTVLVDVGYETKAVRSQIRNRFADLALSVADLEGPTLQRFKEKAQAEVVGEY